MIHKSEDTHSISVDAATFWSADPLLPWLARLGRLQTFNFNYYIKHIHCLLQNDQKLQICGGHDKIWT